MQYDDIERTNMLGTLEQEKELATSQRERDLRSLQARKHESAEYSDVLDEIENVELYEENLREFISNSFKVVVEVSIRHLTLKVPI